MSAINLDSIEKYELYEKAVEQTRRALERDARNRHRQSAWMGEMALLSEDIDHVRGAAIALEAVFGVYSFAVSEKLGITELYKRHREECDKVIARNERRSA